MAYRLKKDLGELKQGTALHFMNGVFVASGAAFDPYDVVCDGEHFEEVQDVVSTVVDLPRAFKTI